MNEASGALLLQAEPSAFDPSFYLMLGSIFLIFYFLVMRPESKRRKEQEDAVKGAERNDTIVTTGGIQGTVTGTTDDIVTIEIAKLKSGEPVRVKIQRSAIQGVTKATDKDKNANGKAARGGEK